MWLDNLIPDSFFISGFALIFLLIIYLPFIAWLAIKLWRFIPYAKSVRLVIVILFLIIVTAVPLGDVYVGSLKLEHLCEAEGGTHIYKTVKADGFYSRGLYENRLDHGYNYIEGMHKGKLYRITNMNGENIREEIKEPKSQYILDNDRIVLSPSLAKIRYFIADRKTGEILAERTDFPYYGGWLDRYIFLSWFGGYRPAGCDIPLFNITDFYLNVLIPSNFRANGGAS